MSTLSYWLSDAPSSPYPSVHDGIDVDFVVVGGGITGVTAAYLAKKAGRTVVLLERERCGGIDTGHTTAHLTAMPDLSLAEIERTFGAQAVRAVWDAGRAAIDQISTIVRAEKIACDFRWVPGYLHAPVQAGDDLDRILIRLQEEAGIAHKLGIEAEFLQRVPIFDSPGVKFSHQALFHPLKYLRGLLKRIEGEGSHVFEHSPVDAIEEQEGALVVHSGRTEIRCRDVFLATHTPLTGKAGLVSSLLFQTKLYLHTSYALSARLRTEAVPGAYWDTNDPYSYLRVERSDDGTYVAIYGGEDHKTGQESHTQDRFDRLERAFRELFPEAEVQHRWSGQVIETNDGLPFIGETAPHQFAATGYAGNGMTFGTLGAMMAVDYLSQRRNPWSGLFSVDRKTVRGGTWEYLRENFDYPYYLVRQLLAPAEDGTTNSLKLGEGKVLAIDGKKVAAYRGEDGKLTLNSPVCPHLKCIVEWNPAEKTWDCPCHGSRFRATGEVISGPSEEDLAPFEPAKDGN